jgi:hypothetical protein
VSGRWIRSTREHHCRLPKQPPLFGTVLDGDLWECSCGKRWVVTVLGAYGETLFQWKPVWEGEAE